MRWLVGYSTCALTRAALEAHGHEVWTCDLRADPHPRHLQCDIWEVAEDGWDAGIFHPTCKYLTVAGAWAFADPDYARYPGRGYHQKPQLGTAFGQTRRDARARAVENFKRLDALPYPTLIENPAPSFLNVLHRPPDQVVQPYEFGCDASKSTGLWLDRLPPLRLGTPRRGRLVEWPRRSGRIVERWSNQTDSGQSAVGESEGRWLQRSRTYPGIAAAFGQLGAPTSS